MFLLQSSTLPADAGGAGAGVAAYRFIEENPTLRYFPSKWAEFVGDNLAEELNLPIEELKDREMWTVAGLNFILTTLVGELFVFGAIEHESELFEGTPKIKCYPFQSNKHHGKNPQVSYC
jgi:hypothetical protein